MKNPTPSTSILSESVSLFTQKETAPNNNNNMNNFNFNNNNINNNQNKVITNNQNASTTGNNNNNSNQLSFNMDYFNKNMEAKKTNAGSTYNFKKNKADPFANLVSFKK